MTDHVELAAAVRTAGASVLPPLVLNPDDEVMARLLYAVERSEMLRGHRAHADDVNLGKAVWATLPHSRRQQYHRRVALLREALNGTGLV